MGTEMKLVAAGAAVLVVLVIFHRPLKGLLKLFGRSAVGLAGLFAFSHVGGMIGVTLGVNLLNALVLGVLGVPGFGLLLMLNWILQ